MAWANNMNPGHLRPDGRKCNTVLDDLKYQGTEYFGENIAGGEATAARVCKDWKESKGHYLNMTNTVFTKIGVGMTELIGSDYRIYWAQIFN